MTLPRPCIGNALKCPTRNRSYWVYPLLQSNPPKLQSPKAKTLPKPFPQQASLSPLSQVSLPLPFYRQPKLLQNEEKKPSLTTIVMELDGDVQMGSRRVQVRFVTKLEAPMKVPPTAIAIPSDLTRLGLSTIVNNLIQGLEPDWQPYPFDFIIDGELIRMKLEEFLRHKNISVEKILEIEYIKAVVPRKQENPCPHDDWVSAVSGANPRFMLSGSYDNFGRIWKADGLCSHILEGHMDAVTSVSFVNPKDIDNKTSLRIATASKDRTLRLWKFDAEEAFNHPKKITAYKVLQGHTSSVQSVASHPSGDMVCSGSWDSTISLWKTNDNGIDTDTTSTKKRKVGTDAKESQLEGRAESTLVGHTQCVSSVVWPEDESIYSASWDHSIRKWDVETGRNSLNVFTGKAMNCIDIGGEASSLIAAGGSDPTLRIWDPRKPGTLAPVFQFKSHKSWITSCKWHAKSWFHLVSASHDGKIMLWDLRTPLPVAIIESHQDKVLSVDWWKDDCLISGGADSKLRITSQISIL